MKNKINFWYHSEPKLWTKEMVANAVVKKVISEEDYAEITGEIYKEVE